MPGFMGLRGLENKTPWEMEKERKGERRSHTQIKHASDTQVFAELRSREKVQEVLQSQIGDMSAYNKTISSGEAATLDALCHYRMDKIMSGRVAVLSFDDTLLTAQSIFSSVKFRHLPIVDDVGNIIGIISDRDVLRLASPFFGTVNEQNRDREIMSRKIGVIMTRNPTCVGVTETIINAIRLLTAKGISCLPVVENEGKKLLGIVTWRDIVRAFCPAGFTRASDSNRLKIGVHVSPESSEGSRIEMSGNTRIKALEDSETRRLKDLRERAKKPQ